MTCQVQRGIEKDQSKDAVPIRHKAGTEYMQTLINKSILFVEEYMQNYDSSHDMSHIRRVCNTAMLLVGTEGPSNGACPRYDVDIIMLASLLHDVGDRKYLKPGEQGNRLVQDFLSSQGASLALADKIQDIVNHVSYSSEIKNPAAVTAAITRHPELAVVQDADRLDALGAVGIGRCFSFNAARSEHGAMQNAIQHFEDKLGRLEGMMKTDTGKAMAAERTRRLDMFREWWHEENVR